MTQQSKPNSDPMPFAGLFCHLWGGGGLGNLAPVRPSNEILGKVYSCSILITRDTTQMQAGKN